ncbi:MAG: DUF1294 domain-containing protein [Clostridia bacterium]|nr:DUF1294 domain-containing protein [Clostridia bacterium]
MTPAIICACIFGAISLIAFILYAVDKRRAIQKKWRIPEATLIGFSMVGGAAGGYLAMLIARHKTKHWYFHFFNILGLIWQVGLVVFLAIQF